MIRKLLLITFAAIALTAAPAAAQYPFTVTPGSVRPGSTVTVTGQGCRSNEAVEIHLAPKSAAPAGAAADAPLADETGPVVGTGTSDAEGKFSVEITIPAGTAPGTYTVSAVCVESGFVQSQDIQILGDTVTPTTTGSSGGSNNGNLPRTGSNLNGFGLAGAGMLLAGGLFLVAARRRNAHA